MAHADADTGVHCRFVQGGGRDLFVLQDNSLWLIMSRARGRRWPLVRRVAVK